jgi:hypothetical protein
MERRSSTPPLMHAPLNRRRLLALTAAAGAGVVGAATIGPLLTTEAAGRDERDAVRITMRKLWEDHVVWTRMVIVSAIAGSPDLDAATQRLLSNQDDIGDAIVPYFGFEAGAALAALLREHIIIAATILGAAKAGDDDGLNEALASWYVNGDEIAAFLHRANPRAWPLGHMQVMMREHLDLTLAEATARLTEDWAADVAAYDRVHDAILLMADMLADGLTDRSGHRGRDSH